MIDNVIDQLTDLTAAALANVGYDAVKDFAPDIEAAKVKELKIYVLPADAEYETLSRGATQKMNVSIECGFYAGEKYLTAPEFLAVLHDCASRFAGLVGSNGIMPNVNCIEVAVNPVYDGKMLREKKILAAVLRVTYQLFYGV